MHLAEVNIARLAYPLDDSRVAGFVDRLDSVNALAERTNREQGGRDRRAKQKIDHKQP